MGRLVLVLLAALSGVAWGSPADETYVAAMDGEHRGDSPVASPAAQVAVRVPLEEKEIVYGAIGGRELRGYVARPRDPRQVPPGILLIHEWWGLNDNIRSMARRLAAEGYTALAVDLYDGEVAEHAAAARDLMRTALARSDAVRENLRQAHRYLETTQHATRTGSVGWCFGGGWALESALLLPGELDAVVMYYGRVVTDRERLRAMDAPLLGHFGAADRGIPLADVRAFEAILSELGAEAEIHVYEGAGHAFANPSGTRYNALAAERAWARTLAFFRRTLN